jgi:hypothetical protein
MRMNYVGVLLTYRSLSGCVRETCNTRHLFRRRQSQLTVRVVPYGSRVATRELASVDMILGTVPWKSHALLASPSAFGDGRARLIEVRSRHVRTQHDVTQRIDEDILQSVDARRDHSRQTFGGWSPFAQLC